MLEDALALCEGLEQRCPGSATLVVCGELLRQDVRPLAESLPTVRVVTDQPALSLLSGHQLWRRLARLGPLRVLWTSLSIGRRRGHLEAVFDKLAPQAVIVFEDRVLDPEMIWLDRAARLGIPTMLIRYASSSAESDAWTRRGKAAYSLERGLLAWARRLFARAYPAHALDLGMGRQIFYTLWDSLALAIRGMAGTHPWVVGGGRVALTAVQGQTDFEEAARLLRAPERFRITGQPSWDAMARVAAQRERAQHAVRRNAGAKPAPLLICALPQWGEHLQMPWQLHIDKIAQLCAVLQRAGFETVLSLHPKAERERYQSLADRHNLEIAQRPLSAILPAADLFVASWSSTLRWSAMLGIPSINLDWAGQGYTLFAELTSLPMSREPGDLEPLLSGFAKDAEGRQALGERLRKESSVYGTIDGQAGQRILSLIENLVARGNNE
jgi:hypothetical protein